MDHTKVVLQGFRLLDSLISENDRGPILLTGNDLTIPQLIAVSRHNATTQVAPAAVRSMESSLEMLKQKIEDGEIIYGVNTGFGGSADTRTQKFAQLQEALIRELHYGILPLGSRDFHTDPLGKPFINHEHDLFLDGDDSSNHLSWSWTRAAILVRINSLISGCSAIRPVLIERMQDLLRYDIVPMIPTRGSISASGDLSPLSYITGAIQGKSSIRVLSRGHEAVYADTAFMNANLESIVLEAKEGLAMTNGTSVSAAAAALTLHDTNSLAVMAQILTAMTVEALTGTTESFHPFFAKVRPHPGQIESARNILAFLADSKLTRVNNGAESTLRQDRYSIRTAPQWLGPILEDLVLANAQISIECNSATDNPLVTPEGEFLHGGNFQAKSVTSAMEKTRQGIQGIGRMLFSQCTELINSATNRGLPPNLVAEDPSITMIFKGTDLNIAALTAELGFLANPVNHVQTAEMGNQSLNSLALISTRYTHTANDVLSQLMAAHLIAACQALDLRALHVQFVAVYRAVFFDLVAKHYGRRDELATLPQLSPLPLDSLNMLPQQSINTSNGADLFADLPKLTNVSDGNSAHPPRAETGQSKPEATHGLSEMLWSQLLKSFETTSGLDARERFPTIAKSLRPVLLDHPAFNTAPGFVRQLETFTQELSVSLMDTWCNHRNAYLVQGDATQVLGKASKAIYAFVRNELKVPLLATRRLMTPEAGNTNSGLGRFSKQAPTVGSYTGIVYRALKNGTLAKVAIDILESCV